MLSRARKLDLTAMGAIAVLLGAMAFVWFQQGWPFSSAVRFSGRVEASPDRTGTILMDRGGGCEKLTFDNESGHITASGLCGGPAPAAGQAYPVPPPAGTMRRLGAISKSFGHQDGR
jgi:hypothetical protein